MRQQGTARAVAIAVTALLPLAALAACSSDDAESAASASSSTVASSEPSTSLAPTASSSAVPSGAAAAACAAYFDLDLLNSAYAGGAVADGDYTEDQIRTNFQATLKELVGEAKSAADDGSANRKLLINAKRMKRIVASLGKEQALSDLSKKQQTRFAKSSLRVQKACDRAGFPLPDDNATARTAAGI